MQFINGKYFKLTTDARFYLIRDVKKDKDGEFVMWLDIYNIVNGAAVLVERPPAYGYTPDAFKRYIDNGNAVFSDVPFAEIPKAAETPAKQVINPAIEVERKAPAPKKAATKKKTTPPATQGGLF